MHDTELQWHLRQLPRELDPARDLWPSISGAIARQRAPQRPRWLAPFALAASVLLVAGLVWRGGVAPSLLAPNSGPIARTSTATSTPAPTPTPAPAPGLRSTTSSPPQGSDISATVITRETHAVTLEYQAALRQFQGAPVPAEVAPTLESLDRSVVQIRQAIAADPDSVFLLEQLRRTYSTRLALTQLAITG